MQWMRCGFAVVLVAVTMLLSACGGGGGPQPTRADVETAMRAAWERRGDDSSPRTTVTFNDVQLGRTDPATAQHVVDGVPPGAAVTAALVDFTVRTHYSDKTQAVRRTREASVYLDKFGQWAVMIGRVRGEDSSTDEPAQP